MVRFRKAPAHGGFQRLRAAISLSPHSICGWSLSRVSTKQGFSVGGQICAAEGLSGEYSRLGLPDSEGIIGADDEAIVANSFGQIRQRGGVVNDRIVPETAQRIARCLGQIIP
jgi:hypothetical protein